jgi:pimeloyl-ACP methyl ester carboxylesterase
MDENYSIDTEVNDIGALVDATGATRLFGHSIGGRIALQAARHLPLEAVAVFDPAVNIDGLFPTAFLDPMERALDDQDLPLAMAHVGQALLPSNPINRLPLNARTALTRGFLATPIGRRMGALLPTVVRETAELRLPEPASDYRSITSRLLLAWGSSSPAYYPQICDRLAQVIPGASTAALRGTHNAPNIARPSFTSAMADFLATR